ncbi:esterase family protein [bacterium]|nr:esterase family protein [bacterium]MCI0604903.1 esterase family protein [bacterium]
MNRPGSRVVVERLESRILRSNPLGDPFIRDLPVYLPPSYYNSNTEYPVILCLSGFTGSGWSWFNFQAWIPTIDERMDSLVASGVPEMILVFPDCFTRYGGSQYLDSPAVGDYRSYLTEEVLPFVDQMYRTKKDKRFRGVLGKSSGGFGAISLAMERPELFSGVACHSGDMYFEYCYIPDFPAAFRLLQKQGGLQQVLERFDQIPKTGKEDHALLNTIAMSACYSPNPEKKISQFDLPFDEETGKMRDRIWKKWKKLDPVEVVKTKGENLGDYGMVYIDCGNRDEFGLMVGARVFVKELKKLGISHSYDEFEGGHFNIQHRYDASLRKMAEYFSL